MGIDLCYFLASLAIGLMYIYLSEVYKKTKLIYPTPDNQDRYQYRDHSGTCVAYDMKEIGCPYDASNS